MEFENITPPSDPSGFLPVYSMWSCAATVLLGNVPVLVPSQIVRDIPHKGSPNRDGLPAFQARVLGNGNGMWIWFARTDLFCAWLSHRKEFRDGWRGGGKSKKFVPAIARKNRRRRVLDPEWVAMNVAMNARSNRLHRLVDAIRSPNTKETIEWRRPIK